MRGTFTIERRPRGLWVYRDGDPLHGWTAVGPRDAAHVILLELVGGRASYVLAEGLVRDLRRSDPRAWDRDRVTWPAERIAAYATLAGIRPEFAGEVAP